MWLRHLESWNVIQNANMHGFTALVPFQSPVAFQPEAEMVLAIRNTRFPAPLTVRMGAVSSNAVRAAENGPHFLAISARCPGALSPLFGRCTMGSAQGCLSHCVRKYAPGSIPGFMHGSNWQQRRDPGTRVARDATECTS